MLAIILFLVLNTVADVILTTMKPRLKNVTAEDVLNSLYYFHVDTPSDVFLMGDMQASETPEPIQEQRQHLYHGSRFVKARR